MAAVGNGANTTAKVGGWEDGLYLLIPVLLVWIMWFMLAAEHMTHVPTRHREIVRFQALFCRIILVFPLTQTVSFIAALYPWTFYWIYFVVSTLEAYCIVAFYSLLIGLGHLFYTKEELYKEVAQSKWIRRPLVWCGPDYKTASFALYVSKIMVVQILVGKPVTSLAAALCFQIADVVPNSLNLVLRIIGVVSMVVALVFIIRMNKFLSQSTGSPLEGHNVVWKFIVVKMLFTFVVFNNVILEPLIHAGKIPVDPWVCDPSLLQDSTDKELCQSRLSSIIFVFEILVLMVPACITYRHYGLRKSDERRKGGYGTFLFYTLINWFDLEDFILGKVVARETNKPRETIEPTTKDVGALKHVDTLNVV